MTNYKDKIITVEGALDLVKSDFQIVTGVAGAEAQSFLSKLHTISNRVTNVTVNNCLPIGSYEFFTNPEYTESFNVDSWFYSGSLRKASKTSNITYIPNN